MRILLFGATGMVGQGVLRECLGAPDVSEVVVIGRTPTGLAHARLSEIVHADLFDLSAIATELGGFDACFFCIGVTSSGMPEPAYVRLTYELTLGVAQVVASRNPDLTFVYVSGAGADSSEEGGTMWARVRGRTENALLRLPFKAYAFRPGLIRPMHGVRSKTAAYRWFYRLATPLLPLLRRWMPGTVLTTEVVGQAMLAVARRGAPHHVLESADIDVLARDAATGH